MMIYIHALKGPPPGKIIRNGNISKSHLLDQAAKIRRSLPVSVPVPTSIPAPTPAPDPIISAVSKLSLKLSSILPSSKSSDGNNRNNQMYKHLSSSKTLFYPTYYTKKNNNNNNNNNKKRGFSNWLLENKIMIGQYPGPTPEKDGGPSLTCAQNHMNALIVQSNICLFCSLQSEIPPQDDYVKWVDENNGKVYLPVNGGREDFPNFFGHYAPLVQKAYSLSKKNKGKIDGNSNGNGNGNGNGNVAPTFLHAPIIDLSTPSSSSLYSTLSHLLDVLENNPQSAIYIHCWGGRGRAGLVGACLLSLIFPDLSASQVLDWVQRGYDTRFGAEDMPLGLKQSPQTASQREFVHNFVNDVQSGYD